jgi:sialidase-1
MRVSYDEGMTFPHERPIMGGQAGYSDLTILKDGTVGILWEHEGLRFTRLNLEYLEPPNK